MTEGSAIELGEDWYKTNGEIMMSNSRRIGARLVLLLAVLAVAASAATLSIGGSYDLSTATPANWTITLPTVLSGPAVMDTNLGAGSISFNSTGTSTATGYDGFWVAALTFTLPAGLGSTYTATLTFNGLYADDRVVLELEYNPNWQPRDRRPGCWQHVPHGCPSPRHPTRSQ